MLKYAILIPAAMLVTTSLAQAQVGGSYRRSCENIEQRGPYLTAECGTVNGGLRRSSLDLRGCQGGVANSNGRLTCNRRDGGGDDFGGGYRPHHRRYVEPDQDNGDY